MTVTQIVEEARNNLNALTDTLWSDAELYLKLYRASLKLARRTRCIEGSATQTTVASTAEYTNPSLAIEIWRVTYNGKKLQKINYRQYDSMNPSSLSSTGTPSFYLEYDSQVILYPTPDAAKTLKIWSFDKPAVPTVSSTLETPSEYHDVLVDGTTFEMCPKDLGHPLTVYWRDKFERGILDVEAHVKKRRRGDRMAIVSVEEQSLATDFGII